MVESVAATIGTGGQVKVSLSFVVIYPLWSTRAIRANLTPMVISAADLLDLSVKERINLVGEIWDSIAAIPEQVEVSPEVRDLLEKRLTDHRDNPNTGSSWEEVKARILSK